MAVARKIVAGLGERCSYTLREPSGGEHPLMSFLFGSRRGYCMHFATALATMLRIHRIPCRIAVGFHGGIANGAGPGRIFGSQHAHAWVELPLESTGWTLIDPTPASGSTARGWPSGSEEIPPAEPAPATFMEVAPSVCFFDGLSNPLANPGAFLVLTFLFVATSLGLLFYLLRRAKAEQDASGSSRKPSPDAARARRMLEQILGALEKNGLGKNPQLTLEQYPPRPRPGEGPQPRPAHFGWSLRGLPGRALWGQETRRRSRSTARGGPPESPARRRPANSLAVVSRDVVHSVALIRDMGAWWPMPPCSLTRL